MNQGDITGEPIGLTASDDDDVPDFEEVPVWIKGQSDPGIESFVFIERGEDVLQYGRLSGGTEYSDRAQPEKLQRDMSLDFNTREVRESNLAHDVVRKMYVDLLGEVEFEEDEISVRRPTKLPRVGQVVYELGAEELPRLLDIPGRDDDGLKIGTFESGGQSIPFKLDSQFLSRHVAILGRTGVGKTHTGHVIIEEIIDYERLSEAIDTYGSLDSATKADDSEVSEGDWLPVVTFDIEDDVAPMAASVGGVTMDPATPQMQIPFQLIGWNEFEKFLGDMPTAKQKQVIGSAYAMVRRDALTELERHGTVNAGRAEFVTNIQDVANHLNYSNVGSAINRAENAIRQSDVLGEIMNDWAELMRANPIINIDVGELGDAQRGAVISAVSRMLQFLRERDEIPPFELVIDEAHQFVPSGRSGESTEVVRDLVKTARHIEVGVVLMTQSPSELDSRTLRTCNTYITLALADAEVNEIDGLYGDLSDRTIEQIPSMERGRAIVGSARDIMTHSVPVKIRERDSPEGAETPDLVDRAPDWFDNN